MTHKTLTRGHVAFDASGLFWKIAVRLDSPYLQQILSYAKCLQMPSHAARASDGSEEPTTSSSISRISYQNIVF